MQFFLTAHARQRMRERNLTTVMLETALHHPVRIVRDSGGRLLIIAVHTRDGGARALLVAGKIEGETLRIFTVIETTKIQKYL
ncbi:MAG: DUF4258 domain-containing protein [bacterium]|nr:DUF4258 domain-containing protein [bacterium]MDZ4284462.1 DUF4258 domain-containing protein [Patescibacteria group bacterium]